MSISGRSIMLTGKVSRSRAEMETAIRNAGGRFENAANKADRMDYIIVGYRAGGSKLDNGRNFITENDFWALVENGTRPRFLTRDQASIYSSTLADHGVSTQRTREFFEALDGNSRGSSAVATAVAITPPAPTDVIETNDFDFFEDL